MSDLRALLEPGFAGTYTIERELGRGGMATVFLARDLKHHRPVALKALYPHLSYVLGPERFRREIELLAALTHPHIVPLHDSGGTAGLLWYTMPYVDGESLRDRLSREGRLPLEDVVRVTSEVADALHYAHGRGIIHRDLKPENILLSAGHAFVADFGIARALDAGRGRSPHWNRLRAGNAGVHEPRAGRGRARGRCQERHLFARLRGVRDAGG